MIDKVIGVFMCESFFSNIFTVFITSKPCLAHDGHEIIFTPLFRKLRDLSISFPIFTSLTGSSDNEILIVSPIPSKRREPIPIEDLMLPGMNPPASVIPR